MFYTGLSGPTTTLQEIGLLFFICVTIVVSLTDSSLFYPWIVSTAPTSVYLQWRRQRVLVCTEVHQRPRRWQYCWLKVNQRVKLKGRPLTPLTDGAVGVRPPQWELFTSNLHRTRCQPDENYCLLITIKLQQSPDDTSAGVSVPAGALTDKIIRHYLSPVIADITQIVWWTTVQGQGYVLRGGCPSP